MALRLLPKSHSTIKNQSGIIELAILAVIGLIVVGAGGAVVLSKNATPGSPLYGLKGKVQSVQLALSPSATSKATLALTTAENDLTNLKHLAAAATPSAADIELGINQLVSHSSTAATAIARVSNPTTAATLSGNLTANTQQAIAALQLASLKVPATSSEAQTAITQLGSQAAQVASTVAKSTPTTASGAASSSSSQSCFSSVTSQVGNQPPKNVTSTSCNSVLSLTNGSSTSVSGTLASGLGGATVGGSTPTASCNALLVQGNTVTPACPKSGSTSGSGSASGSTGTTPPLIPVATLTPSQFLQLPQLGKFNLGTLGSIPTGTSGSSSGSSQSSSSSITSSSTVTSNGSTCSSVATQSINGAPPTTQRSSSCSSVIVISQ